MTTTTATFRDELTILRAQVRVVTGRRQCRHVEQPPRPRPATLDDAAALPGAGLPSHGREACQAGDRLGVEAAELRHLGKCSRPLPLGQPPFSADDRSDRCAEHCAGSAPPPDFGSAATAALRVCHTPPPPLRVGRSHPAEAGRIL